MGDTTRRLQEFGARNGEIKLGFHPNGSVTISWDQTYPSGYRTDHHVTGMNLKAAIEQAEKESHKVSMTRFVLTSRALSIDERNGIPHNPCRDYGSEIPLD